MYCRFPINSYQRLGESLKAKKVGTTGSCIVYKDSEWRVCLLSLTKPYWLKKYAYYLLRYIVSVVYSALPVQVAQTGDYAIDCVARFV